MLAPLKVFHLLPCFLFLFNPIECKIKQIVDSTTTIPQEIRTVNSTVIVRPGMLTAECTPPAEIPDEDIAFIWWYQNTTEGFKVR